MIPIRMPLIIIITIRILGILVVLVILFTTRIPLANNQNKYSSSSNIHKVFFLPVLWARASHR